MEKIIIDAEGIVLGRLASFVAKQALEGKEISIVNSEKAIITGNRKNIIEKYQKKRKLGGTAQKGPYYDKPSYMILKRAIRGMLPDHRNGIGRTAFKNIKCYEGIPNEFKNSIFMKLKSPEKINYIDIKEVSKNL
ncbi:MAG: 50S ribosomal protein L13 [Nanoarchaeota archaeon]|nr:50S ribosomal protein L13 [Nanoarchaeota archaeon]